MKIPKIKKTSVIVGAIVISVAAIGAIINKLSSADEIRAAGSNKAYSLNDWVYYDPVSGGDCSAANYWTPFNQDITCYRWSVFTDEDTASSPTVKLILDHNIAHTNFEQKDAAMNNIVSTWADYAGVASSATEAELMDAMKLIRMPNPLDNSINGGEKNTTLMVNNCYYLNGEKVNHAGFWTATAYNDTYAFTFTEFGNNSVVESTKGRGVRPVIVADKNKLTNESSRKDITSVVLASPSNKYLHSDVQYGGVTYKQMQGFTITNSDLVFYSSNADNPDYGLLFGYTGDNFSSAKSGTPKYIAGGHGNDMTFNPNTNEILLAGPDEYKEIWLLDADSLSYEDSIATGSSNTIGLNFGSIGYNGKDNLYIGGSGTTAYVMDTNFAQIKDSIDMPNNNIGQGLEFYKGYVFRVSWMDYACTGHLYCSEDETGSSTIDVYNAKYNSDGSTGKNFGRHVASIYIGDNDNFGELESVAFHDDNIYLGYAAQHYDADYTYKFYHLPYSTLSVVLDAAVSYTDAPGATAITISASDQLTPIAGYTMSQDGYSMSKTVSTPSISEEQNVCDLYGNCTTLNISHSNPTPIPDPDPDPDPTPDPDPDPTPDPDPIPTPDNTPENAEESNNSTSASTADVTVPNTSSAPDTGDNTTDKDHTAKPIDILPIALPMLTVLLIAIHKRNKQHRKFDY